MEKCWLSFVSADNYKWVSKVLLMISGHCYTTQIGPTTSKQGMLTIATEGQKYIWTGLNFSDFNENLIFKGWWQSTDWNSTLSSTGLFKIHSCVGANNQTFILCECFCFPSMFWKLILQKRAWQDKTHHGCFILTCFNENITSKRKIDCFIIE